MERTNQTPYDELVKQIHQKTSDKVQELSKTRQNFMSALKSQDEEKLKEIIQFYDNEVRDKIIKERKIALTLAKQQEDARKLKEKLAEDNRLFKEEMSNIHRENAERKEKWATLREKLDTSISKVNESMNEELKRIEEREKTVLETLKLYNVDVETDPDNTNLDILYKYLQENNDMPPTNILNYFNIRIRADPEISSMFDPFMIYLVKEKIRICAEDEDVDEEYVQDILNLIDALLQLRPVVDEVLEKPESLQELKCTAGQMVKFNEFLLLMPGVKLVLKEKLEKLVDEEEEQEEQEEE